MHDTTPSKRVRAMYNVNGPGALNDGLFKPTPYYLQ